MKNETWPLSFFKDLMARSRRLTFLITVLDSISIYCWQALPWSSFFIGFIIFPEPPTRFLLFVPASSICTLDLQYFVLVIRPTCLLLLFWVSWVVFSRTVHAQVTGSIRTRLCIVVTEQYKKGTKLSTSITTKLVSYMPEKKWLSGEQNAGNSCHQIQVPIVSVL